MLCPLKHMLVISFLVSSSLFSKDVPSRNDEWDLHEFVKHSHALKEEALKEQAIPHTSHTKHKQEGENASLKTDDTTLRPLKENYTELLKKTFTLEGNTHKSSDFYIFISFSLPKKTLLSLLKASRRYGATLVLRGIKEGDFKKTLVTLMDLYRQEKGRVILDPTLFKRFRVKHVPTFLLTQGKSSHEDGCVSLSGDVSPRFALTVLGKQAPYESFVKELLQ